MRRLVCFLALSVCATSNAQAPFDAAAAAPAALERIARLEPRLQPVSLRITDDVHGDAITRGRTIQLSRASLALVHSPVELDALLAVIAAFAPGTPVMNSERSTRPSVGQYVGGLAYAAAANALDPIDRRDQIDQQRRTYRLPGVDDRRSATGTPRGRAALVLLGKVDSCSGAALDVLDRLQRQYAVIPLNERPPVSRLATEIRSQFGSLAMPPDTSCTGG